MMYPTSHSINGKIIQLERFYFIHGEGYRTQVVFATQRVLRGLKLAGFPEVKTFNFKANLYDLHGKSLQEIHYAVASDQEVSFDSDQVFKKSDSPLCEGSVLLSTTSIEFMEEFKPELSLPSLLDFNGILLIYRPGQFVTGVHMYHGVAFRSPSTLFKYYLKSKILKVLRQIRSWFRHPFVFPKYRVWIFDAVGAVMGHASLSGGKSLALFHSDNYFPGIVSFIEQRHSNGITKHLRVPTLRAHATFKKQLPLLKNVEGEKEQWSQILCVQPPLGMSRFLAGEKFPDGSFCLDHTYFQQTNNLRSPKITHHLKFFRRELLNDNVIGPSHPWPCIHNNQVETLIAVCNQLFPDEENLYDLRVFDKQGKCVLFRKGCIQVKPYGFSVFNISAELGKLGLHEFSGTYLISHSASNNVELLSNRIHAQGIYRFNKKFWNGVQSDSSLWSSPNPPIPEMEALSWVKVRRKQYWMAPILESEDIETMLLLANLSYSLHYDQKQILGLRYCEGNRILQEEEVELNPFGSTVISVRKMFEKSFSQEAIKEQRLGSVTIYPKTGLTYCASIMFREKKSEVFMLEHVLRLPKFPHEVSS